MTHAVGDNQRTFGVLQGLDALKHTHRQALASQHRSGQQAGRRTADYGYLLAIRARGGLGDALRVA